MVERKHLFRGSPLPLQLSQSVLHFLIQLEAQKEDGSQLIRVAMPPPGLRVRSPRGLPHELKRTPAVRPRGQTGHQIPTSRLIDQVCLPPPKTPRLRPSLTRPSYQELSCQNAVKLAQGSPLNHCPGAYGKI